MTAPYPAGPTAATVSVGRTRAAELRRAFDATFTLAQDAAAEPSEQLLAIRVGGDPYFLRLVELSAVFAGKAVTHLPGYLPEFVGVAAFRGVTLAVYDLGLLLGYPGGAASGSATRWLAAVSRPSALGVAFHGFEGQLSIPRSTIAASPEAAAYPARGEHIHEVAETAGGKRPIVDLRSIVGKISARVVRDMQKEQQR